MSSDQLCQRLQAATSGGPQAEPLAFSVFLVRPGSDDAMAAALVQESGSESECGNKPLQRLHGVYGCQGQCKSSRSHVHSSRKAASRVQLYDMRL